jgi:NDP-sugar pyrophosphorylase family protein
MNGKLIFDVDLTALVDAYRRTDALGMLVVRRVPDAGAWGALDVRADERGLRIANFFAGGEHMFCGVHVTRPSVIARLPDGEACSIRQGYLPWIQGGERVAAFEQNHGYFAEHSTPARYVESNRALLRGTPLSHPPAVLTGVHASAHIGADAVIHPPVRIGAGAVIGARAVIGPETVIGSGAEIADDAVVERSVVWAGARASGELRDAIVSAAGVVAATE